MSFEALPKMWAARSGVALRTAVAQIGWVGHSGHDGCSLCCLTLRVAKIVAKRSRRHNFRISVGDVLPTNLATAPGYIGKRFCLIFPRELIEQLSFGSHEAEEPRSRFHCACK